MRHHRFIAALVALAAGMAICGHSRADDRLVYVQLVEPCRILDTRTSQGGPGRLTAAHGNYTFGATYVDTQTPAQNGSKTGCVPSDVAAIAAVVNQFNATAAGNIRTWSVDRGATGPAVGTAVYNPSVATPAAGQVLYNPGSLTIEVGTTTTRFYLAVANGELDMTINVIGYWRWLDRGSSTVGAYAQTIGYNNYTDGDYALAFGNNNYSNTANSISIGYNNLSSAVGSVTLGTSDQANAGNAVAIGYDNQNWAENTVVMGYYAYASAAAPDSFVFSDGSVPLAGPSVGHQFWVRSTNGAQFYSSADMSTGVRLAAGAGAWTAVSDRNVKDAVEAIDSRAVLDRVVAMPLTTWHYKAQDPKYRHMGPMAQDFYAAFGLGEGDTGIDTIDADGVAFAAIQGLNAKLEARDRDMVARDRQHEQDRREIAELRAQVAALAAAIGHAGDTGTP